MRELNNITVVIRSVEERTTKLCEKLILKQGLSEDCVHVVKEVPFSKAMRVSYEIGIKSAKKWTYFIDADVLLKENSLNQILTIGETMPIEVFGLSGKLLDKLFGNTRSVGNHLFRTTYLNRMLDAIADYNEETIRPESFAKNVLKGQGLKWVKHSMRLGLHDFEQHYHDIARKSFVHGRKHTDQLSEIVTFWLKNSDYDKDYQAALIGLSKGLIHQEKVKINTRLFNNLQSEVKQIMGSKSAKDSEWRIKNFHDIQNILSQKDHYFQPSDKLSLKYDQQFAESFYQKSYKSIIGFLIKKIYKDIKRK